MTTSPPKVSLITTFYNSVTLGDFVNKAMVSLLSQTYRNIEFICVNDGSNDETLQQLKQFQKQDSRIYIINKTNEGTAQYAKAAGQDAATGDFVMLFDHDDELSPGAIENAVAVFKTNSAIDMVGMIVKTIYNSGELKSIHALDQPLNSEENYSPQRLTGKEALLKTIGRYDFHFRGLVKKNIFQSVSFRFTEKLLNADEIVERQMLRNVSEIASCDGIYTHYVFLNSSAKSLHLKKTDILETDRFLRNFAKELNFYEERKLIFEGVAFKNFINGLKVFHLFKPTLSAEEQLFYKNRILNSYHELNKTFVLRNYRSLSKIYNWFLLSHFLVVYNFYKFKK